ncbi:TPA: ABC transporter ATP-binding protein [Vibrio vulnificus]|nr:ABC transporter ATP-binding protein [Vibrio vulnificus]
MWKPQRETKKNTPILNVNIRSFFSSDGGSRLLDSINFELDDNECLAIIGPNGSGKTTLLRVISQIISADGEVFFDGMPMSSLNPKDRAKNIAVMSQNEVPDLRFTIEDYVALGRIPYFSDMDSKPHREIVRNSVKDVGMEKFLKKSLGALSGGELQRVKLARALAQTPRLMLMDEPTNHLDYPGRSEILSLVKSKSMAVIAVLHDLNYVDGFADNVLVLKDGKKIVFGNPEQVLVTKYLKPVFGLNTFIVSHPYDDSNKVRIFEVSGRG